MNSKYSKVLNMILNNVDKSCKECNIKLNVINFLQETIIYIIKSTDEQGNLYQKNLYNESSENGFAEELKSAHNTLCAYIGNYELLYNYLSEDINSFNFDSYSSFIEMYNTISNNILNDYNLYENSIIELQTFLRCIFDYHNEFIDELITKCRNNSDEFNVNEYIGLLEFINDIYPSEEDNDNTSDKLISDDSKDDE